MLEALHDQAGQDTVARIDLLEGARGALACWVMCGHILYWCSFLPHIIATTPTWLYTIAFYIADGTAPVSIFMMISGFVICHLVTMRREPYGVYITRRFLRLYPAFLCCLALGVAVTPLETYFVQHLPWVDATWINSQVIISRENQHFMIPAIFTELTMLHGLIPGNLLVDMGGPFLGVAWTISTEWQFYLIAPFAIRLAKSLRGACILCLVVAALSPNLPLVGLFEGFRNPAPSLLLLQIQYFFIGGISYAAWKAWRAYLSAPDRTPPRGLVLFGIAGAFLAPNLQLACWILLFSCLCQIAAAPNGIEARIVQAAGCSKAALFIGRISYSIYLVHWPICILMLHLTRGLHGLGYWNYLAVFGVLTAALTIVVSTVLYYFVEAPMIRRGKEMFQGNARPWKPVAGALAAMIAVVLIACFFTRDAYLPKQISDHLSVADNTQLSVEIARLRQAIALAPNDAQNHANLGKLLLQSEQTDEAIEEFEKAVSLDPGLVEALCNLGVAYQQEGRVDEAISQYQKAIQIRPDNVDALNNCGVAYEQKGALKDAIASYRKALSLRPDFAQIHYNLGLALQENRDPKGALEAYQRATELAPNYIKAQTHFAVLLATCTQDYLRNGAKALAVAQQANQSTGGNDPVVLRALAAAYAECGRFPEAIESLRRAIANAKPDILGELNSEIELYRAGQPLRSDDP